MSPYAAVDSAVSVDPTHPFTQPHTDHRRTARSEPPFYVPFKAPSDARGRPFRTGSSRKLAKCVQNFLLKNPDAVDVMLFKGSKEIHVTQQIASTKA